MQELKSEQRRNDVLVARQLGAVREALGQGDSSSTYLEQLEEGLAAAIAHASHSRYADVCSRMLTHADVC